ncbi:MAG: hypothetical protein AAFO02_15655 [Bacteroidota bacterium]
MSYSNPGYADLLNSELLKHWNQVIQQSYERLRDRFESRFFLLSPQDIINPQPASVQWFADPAEPDFCIGSKTAKQLSDWGMRGRHALHNEYCEYSVVQRIDNTGQIRPKRVQITTELREYWTCIAKYDPIQVLEMMNNILGYQPAWEDIYGVGDPFDLNEEQREIAFARLVSGHGNDRELSGKGVPAQPVGKINTDNALFMTHPINGLDDLLYIVMFGALPYASQTPGVRANREQIFREARVEHLACRHADPAAAMGAYGAVFEGRSVSFADPLGMYILNFNDRVFLYNDEPIPQSWIRWSRGKQAGLYQRLEFGPSDDEDIFLDDITVEEGASSIPLTGGFQLLQNLEVGPKVVIGEATEVKDDEYVILTVTDQPINCSEAEICSAVIMPLQAEYERAHQMDRLAPRVMGNRDEEG